MTASIPQLQLERRKFTQEEIVEWISKFKYGNINDPDYRKEIIDIFVNSVYVYDDKIVFGIAIILLCFLLAAVIALWNRRKTRKTMDTGFTTVLVEGNPNLRKGWLDKEGNVAWISVAGQPQFEKGSWFNKDSVVRITYHTYGPVAPAAPFTNPFGVDPTNT